MKPVVCFKTVGCRLNQAETAQIAARFEAAGYTLVEPGGACDVAVIHTCTITHGAERDCIRWARRLRREGARRVVLAGCAVEHNGEALQCAAGADLIAGQAQKFELPVLLHRQYGLGAPEMAGSGRALPAAPVFSTTRALVKAQDGCDFRCSYCVVPETRGLPRSRPLNEVLDDVKRLADAGHREITLTGANLGCYHAPPHGLIHLLEAVEGIADLVRFRIGSIECTTVENEVIDFMADSRKLCRYLHLPLQSGDDGVLARMRRRYSVARYGDTVERAMARIPGLGLGTDVITGFPGETGAAFDATLALIERLPFSNLHVFPYSPRRGTPAATLPEPVPADVRKARAARLIALGAAKRHTFARTLVGQAVTVLIEQRDAEGWACGWSGPYLPVRIADPSLKINDLATVAPKRVERDTLIADAP